MFHRNSAKAVIAVFLGLVGAALLLLALGAAEQQAIAGQVLRIHILANSDRPEDQALKLQVRDAVLRQAETLTAGAESREEAEDLLRQGLPLLERAGEEAARRAGQPYPVTGQVTTCYFPQRTYADFSLPAGWYRALRLEIGAGAGRNWWCVVYPPLCTAGVTEVVEASFPLSPEGVSLITQETEEYVIRFRCAQWWGELTGWLSDRGMAPS